MHEFPTMGMSYPEGGKIDFQEAGNGGRQKIFSVMIFSHPKTIVHKQKLANCGLNIFDKNRKLCLSNIV